VAYLLQNCGISHRAISGGDLPLIQRVEDNYSDWNAFA